MRLTADTLTLTLREPFATARGTATSVTQRVVLLRWEGLIGFGTTVASRDLPALDAALERCGAALRDASPLALDDALDRVRAAAGTVTCAATAVDLALHDLHGKAHGRALHELWACGDGPLPPTAITIGAIPVGELGARSAALSAWPILKLKLASPADAVERVARVRDAYGGRIRVDASGCFEPAAAIDAAERMAAYGVELLEQPVAPGRHAALRSVHVHAPIPVAADEDCHGPSAVAPLAGSAAAVVVKLHDRGGLRDARRTVALAREHGLGVIAGCKSESALGVTAMAQLAGLADGLDLDGHLDVVDDPFAGLAVAKGRVHLPRSPGLGVARARTATFPIGDPA